jgi:hypothetical protein
MAIIGCFFEPSALKTAIFLFIISLLGVAFE